MSLSVTDCVIIHSFFSASICGDCNIDFFTVSPLALWYSFLFFGVFFMVSLLLEEDAASQESVSSTVGAPCNEVSLCNRAGELGLGYVPRVG